MAASVADQGLAKSHLQLICDLQVLTLKTAAEDPETQEEWAVLLLERAKEAKSTATRGLQLNKALQVLTKLPSVKPPAASGLPHYMYNPR